MKTEIKKYLFLFFFFSLIVFQIFPCSGFVVCRDGKVWFANGEDWHDYDSYLAFYPPKNNEYGRIQFEFAWPVPFTPGYITDFGGINDQGLAFDEYAHGETPLKEGQDKPRMSEEITRYCIRKCADVNEVLEVYDKYFVPDLKDHQTFWSDKSGDSVIIEGDDIIRKEGDYQICTNILQSNYMNRPFPCRRYYYIDDHLRHEKVIDIDLMKKLLDGVHSGNAANPTQYSSINNLTDQTFYLYYFHNFDEYIYIDVNKELAKGKRRFFLPSLFAYMKPVRPTDGEILKEDSVTFKWTGSNVEYKMYYSENQDFSDSETVLVNEYASSASAIQYAFFVLFFVPAGMIPLLGKRARKIFTALLILLIVLSCTTIEKSYPIDSIDTYSVTVGNLEPGKTYYWKIEANASGEFVSTAEGGSFSLE